MSSQEKDNILYYQGKYKVKVLDRVEVEPHKWGWKVQALESFKLKRKKIKIGEECQVYPYTLTKEKNSEIIEVDNNTNDFVFVSACRSKLSGRLYIHIGIRHGDEVKIKKDHYELIAVKEVEC